jgi:hypothetical protein
MHFILNYRRGSFPIKESFPSLEAAIERARVLYQGQQGYGFSVEDGTQIILYGSDLAARWKSGATPGQQRAG